MQTVWQSLLWKEWCEQRWKLAVLSVVIVVPPFLFTALIEPGGLEIFCQVLLGTLSSYAFLAGMFLGMGVAARENGIGTVGFLQSLPIPMWRAAAAKLFIASLVAATPVMVLTVISYECYRAGFFDLDDIGQFHGFGTVDPAVPRTVVECLLRCLLAAVVGTLSILWWVAALGVNRSDEIRAGAIAFLGIAAIWLCGGCLLYLAGKYDLLLLRETLELATAAAPAGMLALISPANSGALAGKSLSVIVAFSMIAAIGHVGVLAWFLYRFGRVSTKTGQGGLLAGCVDVRLQSKTAFQITTISSCLETDEGNRPIGRGCPRGHSGDHGDRGSFEWVREGRFQRDFRESWRHFFILRCYCRGDWSLFGRPQAEAERVLAFASYDSVNVV